MKKSIRLHIRMFGIVQHALELRYLSGSPQNGQDGHLNAGHFEGSVVMAIRLKMAAVSAIRTLLERGWSYRKIARELAIHRETVGRYARELADGGASKPAKVTAGSGAEDQFQWRRVQLRGRT